jgi:hypothetical protein
MAVKEGESSPVRVEAGGAIKMPTVFEKGDRTFYVDNECT